MCIISYSGTKTITSRNVEGDASLTPIFPYQSKILLLLESSTYSNFDFRRSLISKLQKHITMVQNKGLIFKKVPTGWPVAGQDLTIENREINLDEATCPEGGLILKNHYVSFDPYQRGRMRAPEVKSYSPPFELNKPITSRGVSSVVVSKSNKFKKGDVILSTDGTGTEEYTLLNEGSTSRAVKLDNPHKLDPKIFIGALGMPGLTAWSSLYEIGKPKKGETIFISAASGAVSLILSNSSARLVADP